MRWHALLGTVLALFSPINAIFADDAFQIDYHHALLGFPQSHATFFHRPQSSSNASLLYTISDKAILGAVNPKDGTLLWRQALAGQPVENASSSFLVAGEGAGQIISGYDRTVACWDALDGRLIWDHVLADGTAIHALTALPSLGATQDGATQDVIVLAAPHDPNSHATVLCIAGDGSGVRWEHRETTSGTGSETSLSIAASAKQVYYIAKSHASGKAKVSVFDAITGREISHSSVLVDPEPLGDDGQYATASCSNFPFLISSEKPYKTVKFTLLGTSKVATLRLEDQNEEVEGLSVHQPCSPTAPSHFLLHVRGKERHWAEVYHVDTSSSEITKAYVLPATAETSVFTASSVGPTLYFTRSTESEVTVYSSATHGPLARWSKRSIASHRTLGGRQSAHAVAEVASRGTGLAVRIAEASAAGSWSLVRNGELQWTRPEMLAYATIAAWSDNGGPDALAEELEVESSVSPLVAYVHRLKRHASDLLGLPNYLQNLAEKFAKLSDDTGVRARKDLVGTKVVIVGTSRGALLALDATDAGAVKWYTDLSAYLSPAAPLKALLVSNGRAALYVSDGTLVVVNTTSGSVIEYQPGTLPLWSLAELPGTPANAVVKVSADGTPHIAPDLAPSTASEVNALITLSQDGQAMGWAIGPSVERTWVIHPPDGEKIIGAVARPAHDPVASIGKVLGNRSVLYKYLSPNLALLTALSSTTLTVYLVEAVTGAILHTSKHEGILPDSPVPSAISENWFAYSFTSRDPGSSGLSTQLVIAELYESSVSNDRGALGSRTNYSSFSADAGSKPHVVAQAFTVAEPISSLTVTQTAQGITTRQLLATLPNSNAIVGIPREVLNARRPVDRDPTSQELEEGLLRYSPVLDLDPKLSLTHSREVVGIKKVMTSPSLLESTSIVFAFGHDIFGTQVTPSLAFDVLGKGFNKMQLVLTVVAFLAGVVVIRPMVRKKTVDSRW